VNIRFTSSLTAEDENAIAPAILAAVSGILDLLPLAYVVRIDTADAHVYQHSSPERRLPPLRDPDSLPDLGRVTPLVAQSDW
jgi:hypothetical protein